MHHRTLIASLSLLVAAGGIAGCGKKDTATLPVANAPAPTETLPPPPPTRAAQHEIALNGAGANMTQDGLYVTVPATDFTGKKQDEFMPSNTEALEHVAGLLKERPEFQLQIVGSADAKAGKGSERLSQQHAEAVRDFLVSRQHVDAARIEIKPMGDTDAGRAQNGDVVVRIMTADGRYISRAAMGVQHP